MSNEYFLNELSIEGQFGQDCIRLVEREIAILSSIHEMLLSHGISFHLNRDVLKQEVNNSKTIRDIVDHLENGISQFFWTWIHAWPFHQTIQQEFGVGIYANSVNVTNTGPGRAAVMYWLDSGIVKRLISLQNSKTFAAKNIEFTIHDNSGSQVILVSNAHSKQEVSTEAGLHVPPPRNWGEGLALLAEKYTYISINIDVQRSLREGPWNQNFFYLVDGKLLRLNEIAETVVTLEVARGKCDTEQIQKLTDKYNELYQNMFAHEHSSFSDESTTNKNKFKTALTFNVSEKRIAEFCPFHTKFDYKNSRLHFTWPMKESDTCIHIVYLGQKITI